MENGLVSLSIAGTPQGGPLSPLLRNLVLDALDREWGAVNFVSFAMRMIIISTFAASGRVYE
jgi:retron-type reverse transcriptase